MQNAGTAGTAGTAVNERKRKREAEPDTNIDIRSAFTTESKQYVYGLLFSLLMFSQEMSKLTRCFNIIIESISNIHNYENKFYSDSKEKQINLLVLISSKISKIEDIYNYQYKLLGENLSDLSEKEANDVSNLFERLLHYELKNE